MKKPLWETHSMGDVIEALVNWGYGSGEELIDHLTQNGLTQEEAKTVTALLQKVRM